MLQRIVFILIACVTATPGETIAGITPIARDNSNKPAPKFSNGFTIFYDRNLQTVDLYDKNASLRTTAILQLPDTGKFLISDVSASSQGILAVSGTAVNNNGDQLATVIVWCGQQGQIERVVKTEPFGASKIHFAENGHLWAVGLVRDSEGLRASAEHDILHEYDEQGILLRTALPRSLFQGSQRHPAEPSFIVSNGRRVGVYSFAVGSYVELDAATGQILGQWKVPAPASVKQPTAAALTSSGIFYVGGFESGKGRVSGKPVTYVLDRTSETLVPVDLPNPGEPWKLIGLLGIEGDNLIYYTHPVAITRISMDR